MAIGDPLMNYHQIFPYYYRYWIILSYIWSISSVFDRYLCFILLYYFLRFEILCLDNACVCTSEYNVTIGGKIVQGYCKAWFPTHPWLVFCYLRGGLSSSNCPGARKSGRGDYYYTQDQAICTSGNIHKTHMKRLLKLCIPFNENLLHYFSHFKSKRIYDTKIKK